MINCTTCKYSAESHTDGKESRCGLCMSTANPWSQWVQSMSVTINELQRSDDNV